MKVAISLPVGPPILRYQFFRRGCSKTALEEGLAYVAQEAVRLAPRLEKPDILFVYTTFQIKQHRETLADRSGGMSWDCDEPAYQKKIIREAFTSRITDEAVRMREGLTNRQYYANLLFEVAAFCDTTSNVRVDAVDPRTL